MIREGIFRNENIFSKFKEINLTGIDIDNTNIEWCRRNLPHSSYFTIDPSPPTEIKEEKFDLIIEIEVFL